MAFESEGERGDLYTASSIPARDVWSAHQVARDRTRAARAGSPRVARAIDGRELLSATGEEIRHTPHALTVTTRVQVDAGRPWMRVRVDGSNDARDFRMRVIFQTGIESTDHVADVAFGRVKRASSAIDAIPGDVERVPGTAPLHRYVSLSDASGRGATLISDGLAEYEATEQGDIAVTLLRAVGELSRRDLPERPGHAGWPVATPEAQCPGPFAASFAFMPHGALTDDTIIAIEEAADDFALPVAWTLRVRVLQKPSSVVSPSKAADSASSRARKARTGLRLSSGAPTCSIVPSMVVGRSTA
jgi:alpha-mannosidase